MEETLIEKRVLKEVEVLPNIIKTCIIKHIAILFSGGII